MEDFEMVNLLDDLYVALRVSNGVKHGEEVDVVIPEALQRLIVKMILAPEVAMTHPDIPNQIAQLLDWDKLDMRGHLEPVERLMSVVLETEEIMASLPDKPPTADEIRNAPIGNFIWINVYVANRLMDAGIVTMGQLLRLTVDDFLKIPNLGKKSLAEVVKQLKEKGFYEESMLNPNALRRGPGL